MSSTGPAGGVQGADMIEALLAESAVGRLLARYGRACDDGRFEDLAALLAEDAELVVRGNVAARGRAAVRDWVAAAQPPTRRGRHLVANPVVDLAESGVAHSCADFVFLLPAGDGWEVAATGRYLDLFVAADGPSRTWLLARREMVMGP